MGNVPSADVMMGLLVTVNRDQTDGVCWCSCCSSHVTGDDLYTQK